jgi:hypothetical protein
MWDVILKTRAKEARILSCNIGSCSSILNTIQGDVGYLILRISTTVISI